MESPITMVDSSGTKESPIEVDAPPQRKVKVERNVDVHGTRHPVYPTTVSTPRPGNLKSPPRYTNLKSPPQSDDRKPPPSYQMFSPVVAEDIQMQNVMPARSPGMFLPPVEPVPRQRKPHDVMSTESVNAFTPNPSRESFQEARTPPKEEDFILPAELEKQRKAEAKVEGWTIPRKKTPSPVRPSVLPSDHGHHHHLVRSTPMPPTTMSIIDHHQQPYVQSNAMDMSVKRPRNNVEVRRQVLPAKVIWNGEVK